MKKLTHIARLAKPLPIGSQIAFFRDGFSGLDWDTCAARCASRFLDGDGPVSTKRGADSAGRKQAIGIELEKLSLREKEIQAERNSAKANRIETEALPELRPVRQPVTIGRRFLTGLAAALLLADALFVFLALTDSFGLDLTGGDVGASALIMIGLAGCALLTVLINGWCGTIAVNPESPIRRWFGRLGVLMLAIVVAILRDSASPDGSPALAMLGFCLTFFGGIAAGAAHLRLSGFLRQHAESRENERYGASLLADAESREARAEDELRALEGRRRALLTELDDIAKEPERRAAEDEDLRRLREAWLTEGRYHYMRGARLAGRAPQGGTGNV
jgi:hypothetical protein